jgi:hypothetical protein
MILRLAEITTPTRNGAGPLELVQEVPPPRRRPGELAYAPSALTRCLDPRAGESSRLQAFCKHRASIAFQRVPPKCTVAAENRHELSRSGSPAHRLMRFEAILDWSGRYLHPDEVRTLEHLAASPSGRVAFRRRPPAPNVTGRRDDDARAVRTGVRPRSGPSTARG